MYMYSEDREYYTVATYYQGRFYLLIIKLCIDLQQDNKRQMRQVQCNVLTAKNDVIREL